MRKAKLETLRAFMNQSTKERVEKFLMSDFAEHELLVSRNECSATLLLTNEGMTLDWPLVTLSLVTVVMTPERWKQIEKLYHSALKLEPGQRTAFLKEGCTGDEDLRQEVESLLAHEPQARELH